MGRALTIRVDDKTYRTFARLAKAENRSVTNFVETVVKAHVEECAFTDDEEMRGILSDARLAERLRKGSSDAKTRRGTFVE